MEKKFDFHGTAGSFFVIYLKTTLFTMFTLGIGSPWAFCWLIKWVFENTSYEGKKLQFNGNGGELFIKYLIWTLLSFITLGIYIFWMVPAMYKWVANYTTISEQAAPSDLYTA